MDKIIKEVYKLGRLKNYQFKHHRWYSKKFLKELKDELVPWQIGYARMIVERSENENIVGVIEENNNFTIIDLNMFLNLRDM
jgi:hypothetical protein